MGFRTSDLGHPSQLQPRGVVPPDQYSKVTVTSGLSEERMRETDGIYMSSILEHSCLDKGISLELGTLLPIFPGHIINVPSG